MVSVPIPMHPALRAILCSSILSLEKATGTYPVGMPLPAGFTRARAFPWIMVHGTEAIWTDVVLGRIPNPLLHSRLVQISFRVGRMEHMLICFWVGPFYESPRPATFARLTVHSVTFGPVFSPTRTDATGVSDPMCCSGMRRPVPVRCAASSGICSSSRTPTTSSATACSGHRRGAYIG
jgi:hypothetical protein